MGIITEIKLQKRNKNRVSIYVDGKFLTGMQSITAAREGLKTGLEIDERRLMNLVYESETAEAFDKALGYIARGPKTCREVTDYLCSKQFSADAAQSAEHKLCEYGYLDDKKYVESYISCYSAERGINRLKADLLAKGIDKNLAEEKLSAVTGQEEAAAEAAKKYMRTHKEADKNKLCRHLYSKGFSYSVISAVTGEDYD